MDKQENYIIFIINYSSIAKQFLQDKNMLTYNNSCQNLIKGVTNTKDEKLLAFCQNQIINFAPIINSIKGEE